MTRLLILFLVFPFLVFGQQKQADVGRIKQNLKKLNFLGSALYVAAHPDDENTRVIAYLAGERLATTAYLSLTRGDGGQNLIGPEMRDQLGLIRTQELIAARKIDGGQQFFTRANDFGFSKSAAETFQIWNKDEILSDVVRIYRQYQPDVILTRFPPDERAGHGHHTASAMLAIEAFDVAGTSVAYPNQLSVYAPWQPKRLLINTGRWWNTTINENTPGIVSLNVGGYNTLLGESYSEIAANSRSQHKSQGFGVPSQRGDALEFFELTRGDAAKDIFDGVNTTWSRVKGGDGVKPLVDKVIREFDMERPYLSVPALLQIREAIRKVEPGVWRERKLKETEQLIKDCLGLFTEVAAGYFYASPGQRMSLKFEVINRSPVDVTLTRIATSNFQFDSVMNSRLTNNVPLVHTLFKNLHPQKTFSDPYWLKETHGTGLFTVNDASLIGRPENEPSIIITLELLIGKDKLVVQTPVVYKWTDPVKGELYRPVEVVPPVFLNLSEPVLVFADQSPRMISVLVKSSVEGKLDGNLTLSLPEGWRIDPPQQAVSLQQRGDEIMKTFTVVPASSEMTGILKAVFTTGSRSYDYAVQTIEYDHIPTQTLLPKAESRLVRVNLKKAGNTIAYIKGAGDDTPVALRNIGFNVWEMKNEEVTPENLRRVDAVVLGVRAFNTNDRLRFMMKDLLEYVKQGGTLVVQYNTSMNLGNDYSPYPLTLSRDRVTEEDSEVRLLKPDHPALNWPNKITTEDFTGWVQERGLYFPSKWDAQYEALLSMNDKGETPKDGSLLVAKYGEGYYVYTGLSFFRELPEGVPGAYKLLANLVSLGKQQPEAKEEPVVPARKKTKTR
jgi:LmbE family N-acetylglucosaminyl deacetylase